jgi:branched-chain amino acid transport system permease protein
MIATWTDIDWGLVLELTLKAFFGLDAVVFIIAGLGLNVQFGYAGLLNFGQAAFMAAGAYGLGMSTYYWDVSWWWGIAFGVLYAAGLAIIVGVPTLRLRADYLAIVTIALAELVRLVVRSVTHKEKFGGSDGLKGFSSGFQDLNPVDIPGNQYGVGPLQAQGVMRVVLFAVWIGVCLGVAVAAVRALAKRRGMTPTVRRVAVPLATAVLLAVLLVLFDNFSYLGTEVWVLTVGWSLVAIFGVFVWGLMRSPWGRVLKGIREDEDAVRSLGKNVFGYKMSALIIGAVIGTFAGMVNALRTANVQPDNYSRAITFFVLTALVLGGVAKVMGSIIGPMLYWALLAFTDALLSEASDDSGRVKVFGRLVLRDSSARGQFRLMLVGIGLMLLMIFRPQGLFGNRKEMALDGR